MSRHAILILGGTTEARKLAALLSARADLDVVLSLAGRTKEPLQQACRTRIGGFGGAPGLADYLRKERIDLLVDATHPFANTISANASSAAAEAGIPMLVLERPPWQPEATDRWIPASNVAAAVEALPLKATRVFLAIGRQEAFHFAAAPQHDYIVRSIEALEPPLHVPSLKHMEARGPFSLEAEEELLRQEGIEILVSKNSGGDAVFAKIEAARRLAIPVVMIERPVKAGARRVSTPQEAERHVDLLLTKRGV